MKFLLFFCCLFFSFFPYIHAQEDTSYTSKINRYIEANKYDSLSLHAAQYKLEQIQKRINTLDTDRADELSLVVNLFILKLEERILELEEELLHIKAPESVNALYYSAYNTSRTDKIDDFINIAQNTSVNSLVIDIKEIDGYTSFSFDLDGFSEMVPVSNDTISDIESIIQKLHENDIYVIGRIVVFKDSYLANTYPNHAIKWSNNHNKVWTDYKGNAYSDQYSKEVWDYHIELASQAYKMGFDEINFDYVRFPTDGYISQTYYPHAQSVLNEYPTWGKMKVMDEFSYYITSKLKEKHPNIVLSADIFGLVTNTPLFQIGQNLESYILYFDYVAPMIYPSHYASGYLGFSVPDNAPYEIFYDSMDKATQKIDALNKSIIAAQRENGNLMIGDTFETSGNINDFTEISYQKIRPWLQAFHCSWCQGATYYNRTKFRKQIQAIEEFGITGWYSWNASGRYEKDWY